MPDGANGGAWRSAVDVTEAVAQLYDLGDSAVAAQDAHARVCNIVKQAGRGFVARGQWEEAFRLLAFVPLTAEMMDADLLRFRNAVILQEFKRVARVRRRLVAILALVLCYLFLASPTLFVQLENPRRLAQGMSELDWSEGLYWSVITAMTVGYGDIAPQTPYARLLSLWNATLGVMLMGVTAGLILGLVTPRRLG